MREELKARCAEVERLRTEVEQHKGSGGVPDTNNGYPQFVTCNDGDSSVQGSLGAAQAACGAQGSTVWLPDLRRDEQFFDFDLMVRF
jgi:hypothetical protein